MPPAAKRIVNSWRDRFAREGAELVELVETVRKLSHLGEEVTVYPDAEEILDQALHRHRMSELVAQIRNDPGAHPLRRELLLTELLPYQLDGIAFAAGRGRAVLADEMGLGKTIQGVGVAELLARQAGIERVLIVCPASLKSQWRAEIGRFCERSVQLVSGKASERARAYAGGAFFTVCNYEQVLRDFLDIERANWDLIILDEAQRIKNWQAKTSRIIKSLRSPFALVLTGTPLENRLDDLYSVIEFIDDRRLGPAYRFIHRHRVASDTGRVLGYKNLDALRERSEAGAPAPHARERGARSAAAHHRDRAHHAHRRATSAACARRCWWCRRSPASPSSARWTCCGCRRPCCWRGCRRTAPSWWTSSRPATPASSSAPASCSKPCAQSPAASCSCSASGPPCSIWWSRS